jgi:uncharacterized cupredoxin-like copper-binding protein
MHRLLILAVGAALLSACGSSGSSGSSASGNGGSGAAQPTSAPAAGQKLKLEADGDGGLYFEQRHLKAKAGAVTLDMENPSGSGTSHGIAVEGNGVDKDGKTVTKGKDSLTVDLKPGTYEFYCPVDGHRQAGMKGTLTVK